MSQLRGRALRAHVVLSSFVRRRGFVSPASSSALSSHGRDFTDEDELRRLPSLLASLRASAEAGSTAAPAGAFNSAQGVDVHAGDPSTPPQQRLVTRSRSPAELVARQISLERRAVDVAVRAAEEQHANLRSTRLLAEALLHQKLEGQWRAALTVAIAAEQRRCFSRAPGLDRGVYGAYVLLVEPEILAHVTIRETLAGSLGPEQGVPTLRLALAIGGAVEKAVAVVADAGDGGGGEAMRAGFRSKALRMPGVAAALRQSRELEWPLVVRTKVGAVLLELLRRCALVHVDPRTHRLTEEEGLKSAVADGEVLGFPPASQRVVPAPHAILSEFSAAAARAARAPLDDLPADVAARDAAKWSSTDGRAVRGVSALATKVSDKDAGGVDARHDALAASGRAPSSAVSARVAEEEYERSFVSGRFNAVGGAATVSSPHLRLGRAIHEPLVAVDSTDEVFGAHAMSEEYVVDAAWASAVGADAAAALELDSFRGAEEAQGGVSQSDDEDMVSITGADLPVSVHGPWSASGHRGVLPLAAARMGALDDTSNTTPASELHADEFRLVLNSASTRTKERRADKERVREHRAARESWSRAVAAESGVATMAAPTPASAAPAVPLTMPEGMSTPPASDARADGAATMKEAAALSRVSSSLAARVAAHTPHREFRLADGRVVWAVPAFLHHYVFSRTSAAGSSAQRAHFVGLFFVHPRLAELLSVRAALFSEATPAPMVIPPAPWKSFWGPGPYLTAQYPLVRTVMSHRAVIGSALRDRERAPLATVLEALDFLGATPWRINTKALETVRALWNEAADPLGRGGHAPVPGAPRLADLPVFESDDPPPTVPWVQSAAAAAVAAGGGDEAARLAARAAYFKESARIMQRRADAHSLRSDFRLKLEVAKEHASDDGIFFPHNMDFRGRVYPLPPHLNHMGSDLARGLLLFRDARPLGDRGLHWLMVHLANLMGRDKASFADRVAFVDNETQAILAAADRPLGGGDFWAKAENPWQALSACRELATVMRLPAHARALYECRLPVHQDGSCNGLQHYAALGLDEDGAAAVNLLPPTDAAAGPADVYSRVLDLVLDRIAADAALNVEPADLRPEDGNARKQTSIFARSPRGDMGAAADADSAPLRKRLAVFLKGRVDRKVVKQTVMTSVYGVTFIGAREQIWNRLREKCTFANMPPGIVADEDEFDFLLQASSQYLARTTLSSLGKLFTAADGIKDWLADVARAVAARDQPMAWITPLGLPCVQPYRENERRTIVTVLQNVVARDVGDPTQPVSRARQRSAFPPNYIHSLDSSHMFLTALACKRDNITFAAVHDSYWTHPSSVDAMRDHLRAQFVELYSKPLLEDLRNDLIARHPGLSLPVLPGKGRLDLERVKASPYFFA